MGDTVRLPALTLHEPCASLCVARIPVGLRTGKAFESTAVTRGGIEFYFKNAENRSWPVPRTIKLPFTLAIHASKRRWFEGFVEYFVNCQDGGDGGLLARCQIAERTGWPRYGAILGTVEVWGCVQFSGRPWVANHRCLEPGDPEHDALVGNPWASGPYCWLLRNPRPFAAPIPARGRQGLWYADIPPDTLADSGVDLNSLNRR